MDGDRLTPFGFIVFCFAIGAFLIVIPWHPLWEKNFLLHYLPAARGLVLTRFFRGAVSGLGAVDLALGLAECARMIKASRNRGVPHPPP
jgi:hypothetical protein